MKNVYHVPVQNTAKQCTYKRLITSIYLYTNEECTSISLDNHNNVFSGVVYAICYC